MAYKFKVGDRVTWGNRCFSFVIKEIYEGYVNLDGSSGIDMEDGSSFNFGNDIEIVSISELELIGPKNTDPVRDKVVKEIVPGRYDKISIVLHERDAKEVYLRLIEDNPIGACMNSQELRSAAETFLAIADALEGK